MTKGEIANVVAELETDYESYKKLARTESAGSQSRHRMAGKAAGILHAIEKLRKAAELDGGQPCSTG